MAEVRTNGRAFFGLTDLCMRVRLLSGFGGTKRRQGRAREYKWTSVGAVRKTNFTRLCGPQGDFAPQNMMRSIARQVCEQLVNGESDIFFILSKKSSSLTSPSSSLQPR